MARGVAPSFAGRLIRFIVGTDSAASGAGRARDIRASYGCESAGVPRGAKGRCDTIHRQPKGAPVMVIETGELLALCESEREE
jgi:hypothetical protein